MSVGGGNDLKVYAKFKFKRPLFYNEGLEV